MTIVWKNVFDHYGEKRVSKTDKKKAAYVPNREQRAAIESANIQPAATRPGPTFDIIVLCDARVKTVKASYYYAERSALANRTAEPRMGHEFISSWLQEGDRVVIGNVASQLFAIKLGSAPSTDEAVIGEVARRADRETVFARARKAAGRPLRKVVQRDEFVRSPYVVAAAILRSNGKCEMPTCRCALFETDGGNPYLEVHHLVPLSEDGDDTLPNAAALCPRCHREMHYGRDRRTLRARLKAHIASLPIGT